MKETTGFIYMLVDPRSETIGYIGKTIRPEQRLNEHLNDKRINKRSSWIKSLKKSGSIPVLEIIDEVLLSELSFWEMHYISLFRSWGFDIKNMTDGGDGQSKGYQWSEEARKKIAMAGIGRSHPEEVRKKISASNKGRKMSELTKSKLLQAHLGVPSPLTGRKLTEDARKKLSEAMKGRIPHNKGKKMSEEQKNKLSLSAIGRKHTKETIQKRELTKRNNRIQKIIDRSLSDY